MLYELRRTNSKKKHNMSPIIPLNDPVVIVNVVGGRLLDADTNGGVTLILAAARANYSVKENDDE